DRFSLAIGNALVGNAAQAAALEISLAGPTLVADADLACVVYGAPFDLTCGPHALVAGTTFTLPAGQELHIGGTAKGMRAYVCVAGGLLTQIVLGSRSGFEPLAAGACLPCQPGRVPGRSVRIPSASGPPERPATLRVLEGPQVAWFAADEFYE